MKRKDEVKVLKKKCADCQAFLVKVEFMNQTFVICPNRFVGHHR